MNRVRNRTSFVRDTTDRKNLFLLVQLRWLAVVGQIVTILIVHLQMGIRLPLLPMAAVIFVLIALNIASLIQIRRSADISNTQLFLELLIDVWALTLQLYLSGGASNPFISLYLLQVALGAVLLEAWSAWALVLVATAGFTWLIGTHQPLPLPHAFEGELFNLHIQGMFICFVLAASLLVPFLTQINRNLRARDAYLAELRQRSMEEAHIVRMGLLASGAAHELGTPLATLSVILNDWRRMPSLMSDPDLADEMAEMQNQIDRCKAIVSGILMSSGEARGEGTVRTTVKGFLDGLVEDWLSSRSPGRFDYDNTVGPQERMIADLALKQVLFNVLDNALEASPHWIGVAALRQGDNLVVAVNDRGPGFDPAILEELGKPYRSTKGRPGSGLGLFLVVNVLRKLGGAVSAKNRAGGGATVTLTLPLSALSPGGADGDD
ncbi:HAMP domain-containing histidine kinase [Azospirillum sp. YIM B02556]|uniref:histidine kinase n=1 Tax=Azospirillum endophyticum TaxID=2800326 RepID=A0ABS1FBT0_9PROT|nr:ATP-binding protein [Azospirillum endophyticum]MBK1840886.1 HAMP domain-containing histidine kinase [Azospirillum endophyticum]